MEVADLTLRGFSTREIAAHLGSRREYTLSFKTIAKDVQLVTGRWQAESIESIQLAKTKELARLATVEKEAWKEFERSKEPVTKTMHETSGAVTTVRHTTETRIADARYLQVIGTCIAQRSKILGLEEASLILRLEQLEAAL